MDYPVWFTNCDVPRYHNGVNVYVATVGYENPMCDTVGAPSCAIPNSVIPSNTIRKGHPV